jgi:Domain of unknown function (DUF5122) beta-propeller
VPNTAKLAVAGGANQIKTSLRPSDFNIVGGYVSAIAVQPDGKVVIGGIFTSVQGVTRHSIARLNADGLLDTGFDPNADDRVFTISVQPDGKILAGGVFRNVGGQQHLYMARLDAV